MSDTRIALDLALTVRHDGPGGVGDGLRTAADLTRWLHRHPGLLDAAWEADDRALAAVRSLRAAVRALLAHAVRPGAPSPADAGRLLPSPRPSHGSTPRPRPFPPCPCWCGRRPVNPPPTTVRPPAMAPARTFLPRLSPAPPSAFWRVRTGPPCVPARRRDACATSSRSTPARNGASRPAATGHGWPATTSGTARPPRSVARGAASRAVRSRGMPSRPGTGPGPTAVGRAGAPVLRGPPSARARLRNVSRDT